MPGCLILTVRLIHTAYQETWKNAITRTISFEIYSKKELLSSGKRGYKNCLIILDNNGMELNSQNCSFLGKPNIISCDGFCKTCSTQILDKEQLFKSSLSRYFFLYLVNINSFLVKQFWICHVSDVTLFFARFFFTFKHVWASYRNADIQKWRHANKGQGG